MYSSQPHLIRINGQLCLVSNRPIASNSQLVQIGGAVPIAGAMPIAGAVPIGGGPSGIMLGGRPGFTIPGARFL
jgi:hypothetical protein